MTTSYIQTRRTMLRDEKGIILPGAPNALAAWIIADLDFRPVYLTGAVRTDTQFRSADGAPPARSDAVRYRPRP
jgi:hypothetical protein